MSRIPKSRRVTRCPAGVLPVGRNPTQFFNTRLAARAPIAGKTGESSASAGSVDDDPALREPRRERAGTRQTAGDLLDGTSIVGRDVKHDGRQRLDRVEHE